MKKIISMVLALVMVLSLGVSTLADGEQTFEEALNAAQSVTLPYETKYELGSEKIINFEDYKFYGFAVKVNLEAGNVIEIKFYDENRDADTVLRVYRKNGEAFDEVFSRDADNYYHNGERGIFVVDKTDEYYILFRGFDSSYVGICNAEVKLMAKNAVSTPLDFDTENPPVPAEGDLWNWDAESRTLTLKDGFYHASAANDSANITLPADSTLIVEGKATLYGFGEDQNGITCKGTLTVKGSGANRSVLNIHADNEGIYADGALTVENIAANVEAGSDGFINYGEMVIRNAKLDFDTGNEGLDVNRRSSLLIENSTVKIVSSDEAIEVSKNVIIKNCNLNLCSTSEEGIDAGENIEITGGKLVIVAEENALEAKKIILIDVVFDIANTDSDYYLIDMGDAEDFSLPGTFRLYDKDGNQLYEGEWKAELLNEGGRLYVGETEVSRAASVVEEPKPVPEPKGDTVVIKIGAAAAESGEKNPSTGAEVIG